MNTTVKKDAVLVLPSEEGVGAYLSLGADAPLQAVYECPQLPEPLKQALTGPVNWQFRNETTLGRVVQAPGLAPQFVAALMAWGATARLETDQAPVGAPVDGGDLMVVWVPLDVVGRRWGASQVSRTPADTPIVAALAVVDEATEGGAVRQARLALMGVWPDSSVRLAEAAEKLVGEPLNADRIQQVAAAVEDEVAPPDDFYGSADYRRAMAGVLTRRALQACLSGKE
jgi:CO/xanthine dehydrogenase FAD-binding subunit